MLPVVIVVNRHMIVSIGLAGFFRFVKFTENNIFKVGLITVFDAILTSRQPREKLQCLNENLMSNNFRKTAVLKKI